MAVPRIIYPNYARAAGTAIAASSELSSYPAYWLKDQLRSKPWRTRTGWTIVAGFNDEFPFRTDDGYRIGHIVPGNYASGASMATALATAMTNAGYNPRSSLACSGWWRADKVTLDTDGKVSGMADLSGNGRDLSQATANLRPLWGASVFDGRPGIYFDGTASMRLVSSALMSAMLGANGIGTVVMVIRLDSDAAASDTLFWAGSGSQFMDLVWTGTTNFRADAYDSAARNTTKAVSVGPSTPHHIWWRYDQTNLQAYADDADDAAASSTAMTGAQHANITGSVFNLGSDSGGPLKGYIMECLVFPTALTQTDRRGLAMYLKGRYPTMAVNDATTVVSFGTTSASYSTTNKVFTVTNSAGGATVFQLLAATGVPAEDRIAACYRDLGFTLTDKTGALTYTGENVSYQSRHFVRFDIGAAIAMKAGAALDHNAGTGGTFTLEGNSLDLFLSPAVSQALTGDATLRLGFMSSSSYRYWRLVVDDVSNTIGYLELGVFSVSPYVEPTYCQSQDFNKVLEELSQIGYGTHGSAFVDERPQRWAWSVVFEDMPDADRALFETLVKAVKAGQTFFIAWDPIVTPTETFYVFRRDPVSWQMTTPSPLWKIPMVVVEALD